MTSDECRVMIDECQVMNDKCRMPARRTGRIDENEGRFSCQVSAGPCDGVLTGMKRGGLTKAIDENEGRKGRRFSYLSFSSESLHVEAESPTVD